MPLKGQKRKLAPDQNPVHFERLIRRKMGASIKDIAIADKVSEKAIAESIGAAELYLGTHSLEHANAAVAGIVTSAAKEAKLALHNGLTAKVKKRNKRTGHITIHNDLDLQMRALGHLTGLTEAIQPKGGKGVVVNASAAAQAGASSFSEQNYQAGYEEVIDRIRDKVERQNLVPRVVSTTTDDVILEAELDDSREEPDSRNEDDEPEDSREADP
jgi:hypothetical protein